ncbi:hypothetical protein LDENG_00240710 [Lucifuga dentata]|nr:hypothetical protein LDENG_00240710 [Lucifuga dentata]
MAVAGVAATVICFRKRRKAKAGMELELGPTDPDPTELEGVKACPENGGNRTLAHKQPATDPGLTPQLHPSLQQNGLEYEVPLMQEHCPSNNNLTALKPSYF